MKKHKSNKKKLSEDEVKEILGDENNKDLDYFVEFVKSFNVDVMRDSLNFSFIFNLIIVNLCLSLKDHPEPKKFMEYVLKSWEKTTKKSFEPQINYHAQMMQTLVGNCLNEKVFDAEYMRVMINKSINETVNRYKVPLIDMVNEIEKNRGGDK